MKTRIISAAVMLAIFIPCLIFSHTAVFDIVIALLSLFAVFEMLCCIGQRRNNLIAVPVYIISIILPLSIRLLKFGISFFESAMLMFVLLMFYMLTIAVFSKGKMHPKNIGFAFAMVFYVLFGISCVLAIRNMPNGQYLYLLIFISAWITDSGAYFVGVFFGKRKLIPDVSPKKTVEGAIGGIVSCLASFLIYGLIMQLGFDFSPNYLILALLALLLSAVSMCGDLIASVVKRTFNVKDYGRIIPGHGGIMDRFDSIIATASVMCVIVNIPFILNNIL